MSVIASSIPSPLTSCSLLEQLLSIFTLQLPQGEAFAKTAQPRLGHKKDATFRIKIVHALICHLF